VGYAKRGVEIDRHCGLLANGDQARKWDDPCRVHLLCIDQARDHGRTLAQGGPHLVFGVNVNEGHSGITEGLLIAGGMGALHDGFAARPVWVRQGCDFAVIVAGIKWLQECEAGTVNTKVISTILRASAITRYTFFFSFFCYFFQR
jgi:hypothetical protein